METGTVGETEGAGRPRLSPEEECLLSIARTVNAMISGGYVCAAEGDEGRKAEVAVAGILTNLAIFFAKKGRHCEAAWLYERALPTWEGCADPTEVYFHLGCHLKLLAESYMSLGKPALAEPLLERALPIEEDGLGGDHPAVAEVIDKLIAAYRAQGKDAQAEPLARRAEAIRMDARGKEW